MPLFRRSFVLAALLLGVAGSSLAADRIFLQIPSLKGPSTDAKHSGWFELNAASDCVTTNVGSKTSAFCEFSFVKYADLQSPAASLYMVTTKSIGNPVVVDFCSTGAMNQECYYNLQLRNARFTSKSLSSSDGADRAVESWTLSFDAIKWTFTDWSSGGPVVGTTYCFDLLTSSTSCW